MNNIDIDRINELYHKSKSVGLIKIKRTAGIYECRLDICLYRLPE